MKGRALVALWLGAGTAQAVTCPPLSEAGLQEWVRTHGETEVVFFASWCGECAGHIKEAQATGAILVATFDERERAEQTLGRLGVAAVCFTDAGVAEARGVKSVPFRLKIGKPP